MRGERADAELLTGAASDFGCFYDRHLRAVTAFVGSWIGGPDVVFDLVAETFASVGASPAIRPSIQLPTNAVTALTWRS